MSSSIVGKSGRSQRCGYSMRRQSSKFNVPHHMAFWRIAVCTDV